MASVYRLYHLDGSGRISAAEWIEAAGEDEAIGIARSLRKSPLCEIWQGDRLIARIEPDLAGRP